jgi:hypothetical protein
LKAIDTLMAERRGLRILWGDYGSGKTHLLDVVEAEALEKGFVTSRVVLDPTEVPPSHPQRLFRAIVQGLRLPGEAGIGLGALLEKLFASAEHYAPKGSRASRFFSPYLWALRSGDETSAALIHDYLIGEPTERASLDRAVHRVRWRGQRLLALSDYRTYGRVYAHMLGVLASWSRDAGFSGLMLLLDEVEYVDALNSADLHMAKQVLDHLAAITLPKEFLGFAVEHLRRGGHEVHRNLDLLFEVDQPISLLMAATPLPEIREDVGGRLRNPRLHIELPNLSMEHYANLVTRILNLYREAYPKYEIDQNAQQLLLPHIVSTLKDSEGSTRTIVRTIVALCDRHRLKGDL